MPLCCRLVCHWCIVVVQPVLHVLPVHPQRVHPASGVLCPPRRFPRPILRQREEGLY